MSTTAELDQTRRLQLLTKLRHRTLYFIGDSHIRIAFYGMLSRLQIPYPPNKVWRGDRSDTIPKFNATVKFVASYFLNLSKASAQEMIRDPADAVIVVGVAQHHSCHCWTVEKHMKVVREAIGVLRSAAAKGVGGKRKLIWFGVPAQPVNRHLHMKKPIGQDRRDCRNNARHLIYAAHQLNYLRQINTIAAQRKQRSKERRVEEEDVEVRFVDAFGMSIGMAHTSLDGAHFYTWVRDAWLDAIVDHI